jgi:hypothetical protein
MKEEWNSLIDVIRNPKLKDAERKSIAIKAAFDLLNAAEFKIVIAPFGSMSVSSSDGDIVIDSKENISYDEY